MSKNQLISLHIQNFRSLADVKLNIANLLVLFGPNGAGKSTCLDALCLARDCAVFGVDKALSSRNQGTGAIWEGAKEDDAIVIAIETHHALYKIALGYSNNQINPLLGESLYSKSSERFLIKRQIGHVDVGFVDNPPATLKEPKQLSLSQYANQMPLLAEINQLLHQVHYYPARSAQFHRLRQPHSQTHSGTTQLNENGDNLWYVLHQLYEKRFVDKRYDTILTFMQESFPTFRGLTFEPIQPGIVSAHLIEKGRHQPLDIFGIADSYLQMLLHLTALFSEQDDKALILLDEPEMSLHPWALSVLADAIETATQKWHKQILIATQSPVLISQFGLESIFTAEQNKTGQTVITQVSEIEEIQDLLDDYAAGSLYMAESIAPQSKRLEIPAVYETEGM
jgi:predicted ATPase